MRKLLIAGARRCASALRGMVSFLSYIMYRPGLGVGRTPKFDKCAFNSDVSQSLSFFCVLLILINYYLEPSSR